MWIFMFGEVFSALQHEMMVDPVVSTSSISRIVLFSNRVGLCCENRSSTFFLRSSAFFCVCDSLFLVR